MELKPQNIVIGMDKKFWIVTRREKNGNQVKLPLLSKAVIILKKYEKEDICKVNNSLLPKISNQKVNSYLKEIAGFYKIEKNVTFHLARHTYAKGIPIETVSKILGHKKLSTTQIYAKVIERKVSEDMDILQQKIDNNFGLIQYDPRSHPNAHPKR